uniref:Uncharacterized protein n=2 Tax=Panagrolaimus sp. JU765 TaxID=591449 RepID=A0AC34QSK9_9BILA
MSLKILFFLLFGVFGQDNLKPSIYVPKEKDDLPLTAPIVPYGSKYWKFINKRNNESLIGFFVHKKNSPIKFEIEMPLQSDWSSDGRNELIIKIKRDTIRVEIKLDGNNMKAIITNPLDVNIELSYVSTLKMEIRNDLTLNVNSKHQLNLYDSFKSFEIENGSMALGFEMNKVDFDVLFEIGTLGFDAKYNPKLGLGSFLGSVTFYIILAVCCVGTFAIVGTISTICHFQRKKKLLMEELERKENTGFYSEGDNNPKEKIQIQIENPKIETNEKEKKENNFEQKNEEKINLPEKLPEQQIPTITQPQPQLQPQPPPQVQISNPAPKMPCPATNVNLPIQTTQETNTKTTQKESGSLPLQKTQTLGDEKPQPKIIPLSGMAKKIKEEKLFIGQHDDPTMNDCPSDWNPTIDGVPKKEPKKVKKKTRTDLQDPAGKFQDA